MGGGESFADDLNGNGVLHEEERDKQLPVELTRDLWVTATKRVGTSKAPHPVRSAQLTGVPPSQSVSLRGCLGWAPTLASTFSRVLATLSFERYESCFHQQLEALTTAPFGTKGLHLALKVLKQRRIRPANGGEGVGEVRLEDLRAGRRAG
ncbi:hypothetical protein CPB85DRAFT_1464149 [Mucidula mucida]|nr:hypothetical protein CPB85DRAFT_1464149 [Mucidula mucida]